MSRILESEAWFLSIELGGNTVLSGGRENWSWLDACVLCGKGKGNPHTERTCRLTILVSKLHISFHHCHQEPWGEADFITWKSPQTARKVIQNLVSWVIHLKMFCYRCNVVENGLITYYMLLI